MDNTLRVGTMTVDITPPLGVTMAGYGARDHASEGILEPLHAVAIAFEQGAQRCAVVTLDLIGVPAEVSHAIRERVAAETDLPPERILVSATHTHWGPVLSHTDYLPKHLNARVFPEYTTDMALKVAGAVIQAWNSRRPALASAATGHADGVSFNRRPVGPDGKVIMSLTMSPEAAMIAAEEGAKLAATWRRGGPPGQRLSEPLPALGGARAGVSDPALPVLKLVDRDSGRPLAALLAFGCHAVCGSDQETFYLLDPDWPGQAREVFKRLLDCPALVMAGPCGDQVPRVRRGDARQRIGRSIGAEAMRVWDALEATGIGPLGVASRSVRVPVRALPSLAEARAALAAKPDPEAPGATMERAILGLVERYGHLQHVDYEVWAMGFGDQWGLVGLPGEILDEIGLQIKQRSPFQHTAVVELALDCPGYFPTDAARREGGYEPTWSPAGEGAEAALADGAVAALRDAAAAQS